MPPKKAAAVKKAVEDKTFGMKNKKSNKNQQYVKQMEKAALSSMKANQAKSGGGAKGPSKKAAKAEKEAELRALGIGVTVPKKPKVQPGQPGEGEVANTNAPANENEEQPVAVSKEKERTLEDTVDELRAKMKGGTKITKESFAVWREKRKREKELLAQKAASKRAADIKAGKIQRTGRELFQVNAGIFQDDENADEVLEREEIDDPLEEESAVIELAVEVDESLFMDEDIPDDIDE